VWSMSCLWKPLLYIMDRGSIDFKRLHSLTQLGAFFGVRTRDDMVYRRRYSHPVDKSDGLRSDQTIVLTGKKHGPILP
jgi:hypothetical protein